MNVHGQLRVLTDDQMQLVHDKACQLLEEKGIVFELDKTVDIFKKNGVKTEGNTVYITKELVEKCVALAPKEFHIEAPNPARSLEIGKTNIAIHPAGGEPFISDFNGAPRAATRQDFINLQKVYQACDNVDICGYQPVSPSDIDERVKGLYMTFDSLKNSDKPILAPMELDTDQKREEMFRLFDIAYGDRSVDENYVTWCCVCPNSPLYFAKFACDAIELFAKHNQPVLIVSAPMSGITGPVYLLSTVILAMAESLAALVLAELIKPGIPVIMSSTLTYGYLRYASWVPSSPDSALMLAAIIQMDRKFYGLPARSQTGATSSKLNDYQAGMETMQSFLWCALAGVNITSQTAGSLADLMTTSIEKIVLDDELISRVRWMINGLTVDDEQIGWDDLMGVKPLGNFLMNESTLMYYSDYWEPTVSDWHNIEDWKAAGEKSSLDVAHEKVEEILANAPESMLDPDTEKEMTDYIKSIENGN